MARATKEMLVASRPRVAEPSVSGAAMDVTISGNDVSSVMGLGPLAGLPSRFSCPHPLVYRPSLDTRTMDLESV